MHFFLTLPLFQCSNQTFLLHIDRIKSVWPFVWLLYWKVSKRMESFHPKNSKCIDSTHIIAFSIKLTRNCAWSFRHARTSLFTFFSSSQWVKICNGNNDDVGDKILSMKTNKFFMKKNRHLIHDKIPTRKSI